MRNALKLAALLLALGIAGAACSKSAAEKNGASPTPTPGAEATQKQAKKAPVVVGEFLPDKIVEYRTLPASVEAWEDINLSAKRSGTIESLPLEEGEEVTSGHVILRVDTATLEARVNQANAQLVQARKHFERTEKLVNNRVSQLAELDDAVAQRDVAQANLEVAQVDLANATLRAPLSGVVDRLMFDEGEYVREGDVVAKVVQTDHVKVVVNIPEMDVRYLKIGEEVDVILNADRREATYEGKVYYLALTADPISRTFPMYVEVNNEKGELRPGMIVRVRLVRREIAEAIAVPLFAIVDRGEKKVVFVENDGVAQQREVELGVIEGYRIEVTRGLKTGDRVIIVGQRDLVDGEAVDVKRFIDARTIRRLRDMPIEAPLKLLDEMEQLVKDASKDQ